LIIVDVLALTEAFVGTICLIAVHHSFSGRTADEGFIWSRNVNNNE